MREETTTLSLLHGGRRQDSAPTGQTDLLLPGLPSLAWLVCVAPELKRPPDIVLLYSDSIVAEGSLQG